MPVLCAYLFFLLGVVLQRLVMLPVASSVFQQEAAEGAFRYAHTRFRAWAAEIAMYRYDACCGVLEVASYASQHCWDAQKGHVPAQARQMCSFWVCTDVLLL